MAKKQEKIITEFCSRCQCIDRDGYCKKVRVSRVKERLKSCSKLRKAMEE